MADVRQPLDQQSSSDSDQAVQQLIQYLSSQHRFIDQQQSIIHGQEQLIQFLSGVLVTMPPEGVHLLQNVTTGKEGLEQLRVSLSARLESLKRPGADTSAVGRIVDALRPIEPPSKHTERKTKTFPEMKAESVAPADQAAPGVSTATSPQQAGPASNIGLGPTVGISPDEARRALNQYEEQKRASTLADITEVTPTKKAEVTFLELDLAKPKLRVRIPSGTTKIGRADQAYFSNEGPERLKSKFSTPTLIVLVDDPQKHTVSSMHGYIVHDGLKLTYYDKSSNGTFIKSREDSQYSPIMGGSRQTGDGKPIPDFRVLRDGDQIRFGPKSNALTLVRVEVEERRGVKESVWYLLTPA